MSKCIYKDIANNLDKKELIDYYSTHLPKDVANHFNFDKKYFIRIFDYLGIPRRTAKENTEIQFKYYDNSDRNIKIGLSHKGSKRSDKARNNMSLAQKGKPKSENTKIKISESLKGHIPWNKGLKGQQHWTEEQREKYYTSLAQNNWFQTSEPEEFLYEELCELYGEDNVERQYKDDRYPFRCDFYVKSEDMFIELNRFWHHGPHRFDENNPEDIELLNYWKSKEEEQYKAAIYTWTIRDIEKYKIAEENNLNYKVIY